MKEAIHVISINDGKRVSPPNLLSLNVAELHEKLHINLADIMLVEADKPDSRNKVAYIKNEIREYTLMNIPFKKLLSCSNNLIMVNKFTLVSIDAIYTHRYDCITLKNLFMGWANKQITLGRKYSKAFNSRFKK